MAVNDKLKSGLFCNLEFLLIPPGWRVLTVFQQTKFPDAGIQDLSTSISINMRIQKNLYDLTKRCESHDNDESDKHIEALDRRYLCLKNDTEVQIYRVV